MNDIMRIEDAILNADIDNIFDADNYIPYNLEKNLKRAQRRDKTEAIQARRLNKIATQFNLKKDVARSHSVKAHNNDVDEAVAVEEGKQRDHLTYSHIDFNSDGCALNRIVNKESKGEISGWKCPSKRSKTYSLADINTMAYAEAEAEAAEQAEAERLEAFYAYRALVDEVKQMCNIALLEEEKSWASMMDALALC